jgi:hypothetical protein
LLGGGERTNREIAGRARDQHPHGGAASRDDLPQKSGSGTGPTPRLSRTSLASRIHKRVYKVSGMPRQPGLRKPRRMHALVVSYTLRDATSGEHSELCEQLAPAVASVGGLASATWLTNPASGGYGAFFVFEDEARLRPLRRQRAVRGDQRAQLDPRPEGERTTRSATGRPQSRAGLSSSRPERSTHAFPRTRPTPRADSQGGRRRRFWQRSRHSRRPP